MREGATRRALLLVALAAVLPYAHTLAYGFVFDDHGQISANPRVQSFAHLPGYFTGDVWKGRTPLAGNYYRPVFLSWLLVNHTLSGGRPLVFHLATVALHAVASVLVFLVALRLAGSAALVAGLVFALHPVHVEAVAWVSGATEPLAAVFVLAAFLAYLKSREGGTRAVAWRAASLGAFALALLSKESALVLPVLLVVHAALFRPEGRGRAASVRDGLLRSLPYAALGILYLAARWAALGGLGHARNAVSTATMARTWPLLLFTYLRRLVWPVGLSAFDDTAYVTAAGLANFVLPLAVVLAVAAGLVVWSRRSAPAGVAAAWLILPILPVLNTSMFYRELVHDRYLYLPSVGFAVLAALVLARTRWLLVGAVACLLGSLTIAESIPWASDLRLYERGVRVAPGSAMARHNLAVEMERAGREDLAQVLVEQVLARDPDYWVSLVSLGRLYYRHGRYAEAERLLERAVAQDVEDGSGAYLLAQTRLQLGRRDEAEALLRRAIALKPGSAGYHMALGALLRARGDVAGAAAAYRTAAVLAPESRAGREAEALEADLTGRP